jgi:hypothetical protein
MEKMIKNRVIAEKRKREFFTEMARVFAVYKIRPASKGDWL